MDLTKTHSTTNPEMSTVYAPLVIIGGTPQMTPTINGTTNSSISTDLPWYLQLVHILIMVLATIVLVPVISYSIATLIIVFGMHGSIQ